MTPRPQWGTHQEDSSAAGGTREPEAPMGTPPLFARAGSDIAATLTAALKHIAPAAVCL